MKKYVTSSFIAFALILALTLVGCFASTSVASADQIEAFYLDCADGDFVLTRTSTGEELYRSTDCDPTQLISAIESIVGVGGEFDFGFIAPEVSVVATAGTNQSYSTNKNKFSFTATATHVFDRVRKPDGYTPANNESGYGWGYSVQDGEEITLGSYGHILAFGMNQSHGNYTVYAYGTATFELGGKVFTSTGKSQGVEIEISKTDISLDDIDENALLTSHSYGVTVGEIVNSINTPSHGNHTIALVDSAVADSILEVGTHQLDVVYTVGSWIDGNFVANDSVNTLETTLTVTINPYDVKVLVYNVKVLAGSEIDIEYLVLTTLPTGFKAKDLGLEFWLEDGNGVKVDGNAIGQYTILGSSNNANFNVIFTNIENQYDQNQWYSKWATFTVCPKVLTASDSNFTYTVSRYEGFELDDKLILTEGVGGGKTVKIYNGTTSVDYENLTLTIERKNQDVTSILMYVDGQWKAVDFDENGKIAVKYSTKDASKFSLKLASAVDDEENDTKVIAWVASVISALLLVAIVVCVVLLVKKKKATKDGNDEKAEDGEILEEKAEVAQVENASTKEETQPVEQKTELTLEDKYAMHPEFVPTPTVEEAFKGVETEENGEDEKDNEETVEEGKITFTSKILSASVENRAIYNALKNKLLTYRGIKSRVVNGGDYFRRPGKQIVKIIFIGKTIRLALALNPEDYDYNLYHQKDRGNMKKYADTPMFVKVQSLLGVRRAYKLIADLMEKEGIKENKKAKYDDHLYNLTYGTIEEE